MINWDHVHPRFVAIAMDADGNSFLTETVPECGGDEYECWLAFKENGAPSDTIEADIFASFVPFDGDWRDSLELRPTDD